MRSSFPSTLRTTLAALILLGCKVSPCEVRAAESLNPQVTEIAKQLEALDGRAIVLGNVRQPPLASMLSRDVEARLRMANCTDCRAWNEVKNLADWQRFRDQRLESLRKSLGSFPPVPHDLKVRVICRLEGDGYRVENLVFQSRPGLLVAANLYLPAKPGPSLPGIIICQSHQSTKHTGWRQDMAMTWARAGCPVLVPDHLGHGERRQHPFGDDAPHDYHFRYDAGIQLHLVGESLMGWLAWDLMRGVDVLLAQKGVDPNRIIMISEPAGGGDVAAVAASLDPRITGVMVQNFGGPEPETSYPLPKDAEESFDYSGSGSWESTRNLRLSARDGFLPWSIVASVAPRKLIYDHEFYWDRESDPVWKRLRRVYEFHNSTSLTGVAGHGFVVGSAPENSHWLPVNRVALYPVLERWFEITNPQQEYSRRLPEMDLLCITPDISKELQPQPLHTLAQQIGIERIAIARMDRSRLAPEELREQLRKTWTQLLGSVAPQTPPSIIDGPRPIEQLGSIRVERIHLRTEPGIVVPVLLLVPAQQSDSRIPVVVAVAQHGKQEFLRQQSEPIAELLAAGVAVCLPDLRGTGETSPGDDRDRRSAATSISSSEWMLGQSLLGNRLRDLRSVLSHLRTRADLDTERVAIWGDSFARVNAPETKLMVPHTSSNRPAQSEPLGGLLTMLATLFEDDVRAAYIHGGLSDYHSALDLPVAYLPHDAVVPGVLAYGDICDLTAALAPRALWLDRMVDGLNRQVPDDELEHKFEPARRAFAASNVPDRLKLRNGPQDQPSVARWLVARLRE